jgi:hypothetical protein
MSEKVDLKESWNSKFLESLALIAGKELKESGKIIVPSVYLSVPGTRLSSTTSPTPCCSLAHL